MTIAEEFSSWSKNLTVKDIPEKHRKTLEFLFNLQETKTMFRV